MYASVNRKDIGKSGIVNLDIPQSQTSEPRSLSSMVEPPVGLYGNNNKTNDTKRTNFRKPSATYQISKIEKYNSKNNNNGLFTVRTIYNNK